MEHLVPEQMFSTDNAPAEGISAVKALALASAEGQKIWTIDQNNVDVALATIDLDADIETEIRNAVRAGKVATTFVGSSNVGYLLVDPSTGAGAYKIAGGANGGQLLTDADKALLTVLGLIALVAVFVVAFTALVYFTAVYFAAIISTIAFIIHVYTALAFADALWRTFRNCEGFSSIATAIAYFFEQFATSFKGGNWFTIIAFMLGQSIPRPENECA